MNFAARTLLFALILSLPMAAPLSAQTMPSGQPIEVGTVTLAESNVPFTVTLPGRAVAYASTDIRPRVNGMVEDIVYQPGTQVAVGDLLFRLEAATYDAALAAAQAERDGAAVAVDTAQSTVDRYARLEGTGVTTSDLQTARSTLAQAQAALSSAEAALQTAQLNLDRVEIRSPLAGIAGLSQVSVGALVTANQTDALTTVTSMDPIYVDVSESSARMLRVRSQISSGDMQPGDSLDAVLTLEDGRIYESTGTLVTPGRQVSQTTGSVELRFEFDNPDLLIMPGQFLRVAITIGQRPAILVPQRGTERESDGTLSAYVLRDGVAEKVTLTSSGTYQNAWITTQGVAVGDQLIVDGLSNLTDGAEVTAVPVTINDAGVVEDAPTGDTASGDDTNDADPATSMTAD